MMSQVGPRLSLSLLKVEEGLCDGATLYHALVQKSEGEAAETAARVEAKAALKAERREAQAANVERKRAAAAAKSEGRKRRRRMSGDALDAGRGEGHGGDEDDGGSDDDGGDDDGEVE